MVVALWIDGNKRLPLLSLSSDRIFVKIKETPSNASTSKTKRRTVLLPCTAHHDGKKGVELLLLLLLLLVLKHTTPPTGEEGENPTASSLVVSGTSSMAPPLEKEGLTHSSQIYAIARETRCVDGCSFHPGHHLHQGQRQAQAPGCSDGSNTMLVDDE